ncbi:P-loop containing nucleoside triphosphate hydrolase protein [Pholiota molesta]|nr:P-loop containing nucleoside triphosphate hydrolase protein [Pholiota molesta]
MTDAPSSPSLFSDAVDIHEPHAGIGLSDPRLNYEVRKKLDAMNKLHSTGVQIDIDLPQIAVIGSQSAGKSSLIESISGISSLVPLAHLSNGMSPCTVDAPWQCVVSLRFTTDSAGQPLGQARNEQFGDIIYDKAKVEERIRRAQRAILSPHKSRESFLGDLITADTVDPLQLKFSMNCVTLQISGPDVADLSFCDLPGLIASVSGGTDNSIALVENLVTSYIRKPSCIILLTVACETDFENQGAHRLAKQYDPQGKRTIGVLTKPDRIPVGEENSWLPFIRDEKEQLENNWFCVKQPSSNELKLKWTGPKLDKLKKIFSRPGLHGPLWKIPIKKCLESKTNSPFNANTRESLSRLPPQPTSDPRSEILLLLHKFTQDLALQIEGIPDSVDSVADLGLVQAIRPEQEKFKRAIRATAPNFWPFEKPTSGDKQLPVAEFLRSEEGDVDGDVFRCLFTPQKIYIDEVLEKAQRARTRELPGHYPFVVQKTFIHNIVKQWNAPSEALYRNVHAIISKHAKQLVQKHFEHFGQGKLAHQVGVILQQHINECLKRTEERVKWILRLEDVPFSLNTHYLADYKAKFLAYYKGAREKQLQADIAKGARGTSVTASVPSASSQAAVQPSLQTTTGPFQWTSTSFPSARSLPKNPFDFLKAPDTTASPSKPNTSTTGAAPMGQAQAHPALSKVLSGLAEMGMTGVKAEDLPKLLPPDRMEPALIIMADVRAYFQGDFRLLLSV